MTEYDYVYDSFRPDEGETVDIPDDATGITTGSFGDMATVRYLIPVGDDNE